MTPDTKTPPVSSPMGRPLLDRADERVRHEAGVAGAIRAFVTRVRSGDLGSLPVIVGLLIIWTVFQALNPSFLSSNNLVSLLFDLSTGLAVAGFLALSAVAHLVVSTVWFPRYVHDLARGINRARWVEYALSSSLMMVVIAQLVGIADVTALGLPATATNAGTPQPSTNSALTNWPGSRGASSIKSTSSRTSRRPYLTAKPWARTRAWPRVSRSCMSVRNTCDCTSSGTRNVSSSGQP